MSIAEELLSVRNSDLEMMTRDEKKEYFSSAREYCLTLGKPGKQLSFTAENLAKYNRVTRKYDYGFERADNIPRDGAIIAVNHSNSHDILNMYEIVTSFGMRIAALIAKEVLDPFTVMMFRLGDATVIDRRDKESSRNGVFKLSNFVLNGYVGVVFPEGTWNLHPIKPMQDIRTGAVKVAAITRKPIIPTIMEYIEVPEVCKKESEIYKKCVVSFGDPFYVDAQESLIGQTVSLQKIMEDMRRKVRADNGVKRDKLEDVDPEVYVNHTWLKQYGGYHHGFDPENENGFLFSKDGTVPENGYRIDASGRFVPGVISRNGK